MLPALYYVRSRHHIHVLRAAESHACSRLSVANAILVRTSVVMIRRLCAQEEGAARKATCYSVMMRARGWQRGYASREEAVDREEEERSYASAAAQSTFPPRLCRYIRATTPGDIVAVPKKEGERLRQREREREQVLVAYTPYTE